MWSVKHLFNSTHSKLRYLFSNIKCICFAVCQFTNCTSGMRPRVAFFLRLRLVDHDNFSLPLNKAVFLNRYLIFVWFHKKLSTQKRSCFTCDLFSLLSVQAARHFTDISADVPHRCWSFSFIMSKVLYRRISICSGSFKLTFTQLSNLKNKSFRYYFVISVTKEIKVPFSSQFHCFTQ